MPNVRTPKPKRPSKAERFTREGPCIIEGCDKPRFARGWCNSHWTKWRTYGDPLYIKVKLILPCKVAGCETEATYQWLGYCNKHYRKWLKYGDALVGRTVNHKMGEGSYMSSGYRRLYLPKHPNADRWGSVGEHVVIMAERLGRPLFRGESVHHKNGVRDDNRPENLELWVSKQPAGQRPEDLVAWAHEILERYENMTRDAL